MKLLFLFLILSFNSFATTGCFKEPELNKIFSSHYGNDCSQFPETLSVEALGDKRQILKINQGDTFYFYEEDFARLNPSFKEIGAEDFTGEVKVVGNVSLSHSEKIRFNKVSRIDLSQGRFELPLVRVIEVNLQKDFINTLMAPKLQILILQSELIENIIFHRPDTDLIISGATTIQDINIEAERMELNCSSSLRCPLKNSRLNGSHMSLKMVDVIGEKNDIQGQYLSLINVTSELEFPLNRNSKLIRLELNETSVKFNRPQAFQTLKYFQVSSCDISDINFPEKLVIESLSLYKITGNNSRLPFVSERLFVSGSKMPLTALNISPNSEMVKMFIYDSEFDQLRLDLREPKKLQVAYFLNSNFNSAIVQNKQNAFQLSPFFAMFVKNKKIAESLKKQLGRSSVFFSDWN